MLNKQQRNREPRRPENVILVPQPKMRRRHTLVEWYADGFDPHRDTKDYDFELATRQKPPRINAERLDERTHTTMSGIGSLVTRTLDGRSRSDKRKESDRLRSSWKDVLNKGVCDGFYVVGAHIEPQHAEIWIYHEKSQTLFAAKFDAKSATENWLDPAVLSFRKEDDENQDGEDGAIRVED